LKMENGGDSLPEGDLEMGIKFYLPFHGDSVPKHFIKITYIRILYILYLFIFSYNVYKFYLYVMFIVVKNLQ
jgi:hypothetical protein